MAEWIACHCRLQLAAWVDLRPLTYRALKKPSAGLEIALKVFAEVAFVSARSQQIHSGPADAPLAAAYA